MPRKRIILVDCDGVLADCHRAFADACNAANGTSFTAEDAAREWDVARGFGLNLKQKAAMYDLMAQPGTARKMRPLPGALEGVRLLMGCPELQVAICTSPMDRAPTWAHDRKLWVQDHLGDIPVISTSEKWLCRGDVLIDDRHENIAQWASLGPDGASGVWWSNVINRPVPARTEVHQDWNRVLIGCCL